MPGRCWLRSGTSPGGALGLQVSPGQCIEEAGYAVPEEEQLDCGRPDYLPLPTRGSRCRAETLLNAHAAAAQPDLPWSLTSTPPRPTQARRGRCLQMPGACPAQALPKAPACLPTCLSKPGSLPIGAQLGSTSLGRTKARGGWTFFPRGWLFSSPPHLPPPSLLTPTSNP